MSLLPALDQARAERDAARRDNHRHRTAQAELDADLAQVRAELGATVRDLVRAADAGRELAQQNARLIGEIDRAQQADRVLAGLVKDRLLVFTVDGGALDGLLIDADDRTLVLADVHRRGADHVNTAAAPGELYLDRSRVLYVQRLAAERGA